MFIYVLTILISFMFSSIIIILLMRRKRMNRFHPKICLVLVLFLVLASATNAISASIGNAKMILEPEFPEGESYVLERTILVTNLNQVVVRISLEAKGDLEGITEFVDQDFELMPDEEKDAVFKITLEEHGEYEGDIAVSFTPLEGDDKSVGLLSNVQITTKVAEDDEQEVEDRNFDYPKNILNHLIGLGIASLIVIVGFLVFLMLRKKKVKKSKPKKRSKSRKK